MTAPDDPRRGELAAALRQVEQRITRACAAAGRDRGQVCLVVVTKTFPVQDVVHLAGLGVHDIGESRDQEAGPKMAALPVEVRARTTVHFVGQLQRNKARSVVRYTDVVHSLDRSRLASALDRAVGAAVEAGEREDALEVLLQVDLEDGVQADRGGVRRDEIRALAEQTAGCEHLRLRGLMAVAPPGLDARALAAAFARLAETADALRGDHPGADLLSAGMSADLEAAVAAGATHLRVGRAILGSRPPQR